MFLHIGESQLIKWRDIIGIFNLDTLKDSEENTRFLRKIDDDIKDEKTLILTQDKDVKIYLSNISTNTISKRIEKLM